MVSKAEKLEHLPGPRRVLLRREGMFQAAAVFLAERIDERSLGPRLASRPVVLAIGDSGWAVVFRYGVVILFDLDEAAERRFFESLTGSVAGVYPDPESERVDIRVDSTRPEGSFHNVIYLREASLERLQMVAEILAKSVVLSHYEAEVSDVFFSIEPLAADLHSKGRVYPRTKRLIEHIGRTLLIQQKMVGRVEVTEKPELLWEQPDLERFYLRLEDEFELRERAAALERKLAVIAATAETLLNLLQTRRSLRLEWYIVVLILIEIGLMLVTLH